MSSSFRSKVTADWFSAVDDGHGLAAMLGLLYNITSTRKIEGSVVSGM